MLEFLRPIVAFNTWIYIGLGLVALFFLRLIWLARKDRARSIFTLERENTRARTTRAFTGLMVVLSLMLGIYYLTMVAPPILPPPAETATPTPMLAPPPTPTSPPLLFTPTPAPTILPTPIAFIENTPTPPPPPAPGQPANCPNPGVNITQPGDGANAVGVIQISGAAAIDNFDYYKFEFRAPGGSDWNFIERHNTPVNKGVLGTWNSDTVAPGQYEFQLVVVDKIGNYPQPCVIRLNVQ